MNKSAISSLFLGLVCAPTYAQVDVGPACRINDGLRSVDNVFDPNLGVTGDDPYYRQFNIGDVDSDGVPDIVLLDYFDSSHYLAVASGASGDILYSLESVSPDSFYFGVNVNTIQDIDMDNVPDLLLASHDSLLNEVDLIILSGADGQGIARLVEVSSTPLVGTI